MAILVKIPGVLGDAKLKGIGKSRRYAPGENKRSEWFVGESFSFGVKRDLKEAAEKLGSKDPNLGVGQLQECTITKSMDAASSALAKLAIYGSSERWAIIDFVEVAGGDLGQPLCYLRYILDHCFILSWTTSGNADERPTEEVTLAYYKIAFGYRSSTDGKHFDAHKIMAWDNVRGIEWTEDVHEDLTKWKDLKDYSQK